MALRQLIYMSTLAAGSAADLPHILTSAARNNHASKVTGMLLYSDCNVLQVLEGEDQPVRATFSRIERDVRHYDIYTLMDDEVHIRHFDGWCTGHGRLSQANLKALPETANPFQCSRLELEMRVLPGAALDVLRSFATGAMGVR